MRAVPTGSVGRGVSALVVTVNGNVQAEVLRQVLVLASPKHVGKVADEIQAFVDSCKL
jgi:hypothetical protein